MRNKRNVFLLIVAAVVVTGVSLWGPELLAGYRDGQLLNQVQERRQKIWEKDIVIL